MSTFKPLRASQARGGQDGIGGTVSSNVLVNILKPVNLGNTFRCGVGKSGLVVLSRL